MILTGDRLEMQSKTKANKMQLDLMESFCVFCLEWIHSPVICFIKGFVIYILLWCFIDEVGTAIQIEHFITKTRLFKYTENLPPKNEIFSEKNCDIFHISAQNIDCGYSLEPPRRGGSNEYP